MANDGNSDPPSHRFDPRLGWQVVALEALVLGATVVLALGHAVDSDTVGKILLGYAGARTVALIVRGIKDNGKGV